jgi:hypothetical protein
MHRRLLLLALVVALPTAAIAQRGGGGRSRATQKEDLFKDDEGAPKGPQLRARDVEDISPIKLLIDKRKDLKLTDVQLDGLRKSEGALKEKNGPLLKSVDSLVREMKPPMNRTPESDARLRDARVALQQTLSSLNENYDAAAKEAVAGFDADQQSKANELLAKLKEDGDKRIREKMGTRG